MCFLTNRRGVQAIMMLLLFASLAFDVAFANEEALPWDKRIAHGQLDNGLRYYFFDARQDQSASQDRTFITLLVNAGAMDEQDAQVGVAHMVEHMVFHESDGLPNGVRKALKDLGLRQGREFNAMTNAQTTRYMINLPSKDAEKIARVLSILEQIAFHAQIRSESLTKERLIIEEEWRGKLSHASRINDEKKALLRVGSRYAKRPVIGTQHSIQNMPASELQRFYQDWYVPNNMALVVVGAMDPTILKNQLQNVFSAMPYKALPKRISADPTLDNALKVGHLVDKESRVNRVAFLYRFKVSWSDSKQGRRDRLIDYLTRKLLSQQVHRQQELPAHVRTFSSSKGSVSDNVDILGFSVNVDEGYHKQGLTVLLTELARLKQHGFWQQDFDQMLDKTRETAKNNIQAATERGDLWSVKLLNAASLERVLPDPTQDNHQVLALLDSIQLSDVNRRLRQWLSSPDRILYSQAAGGREVSLGSSVEIERQLQHLESVKLAVLNQAHIPLSRELDEVKAKGAATLLSRQPDLGLSQWQLSNGDRLTLVNPGVLSKRYKVTTGIHENMAYFRAISDAGYGVSGDGLWGEQLASQMAEASGVYSWSDASYQEWKTRHRLSTSIKQTAQHLTYLSHAPESQLSAILGLYHSQQSQTGINQDVYDSVMATLKRRAASSVIRPKEQFAQDISKARFREYQGSTPRLDTLQKLDKAQLEWVRQRQAHLPTHYLLATHLPEKQVIEEAAHYLATIVRMPQRQVALEPMYQVAGKQVVDKKLNSEPKAEYRLYAYQPLDWSPQRAVQLTYLGERLENQLKQRLRSELQGVYSVRVGLDMNEPKNRAELQVQFSADPERIDELAQKTKQVIQRLPSLVNNEWAEQVHQAFLQVEENRLSANFDSTLIHRLQLSLAQYGDTRYLDDMANLSEALTVENLTKTARQLSFNDQVEGFLRPLSQSMSLK